jgi:hypothetical protein
VTWVTAASLIPSFLALAGALVMLIRWVGKIDRNTEATERLTRAFDAFSDKISGRVDDHEVRIRVLESRIP